jgi:hypothetical protein
LRGLTGKDPILVPGNHDQRKFGNSFRGIGREFAKLADLEWGKVVVDEEIGCIFLCFNSSEGGDWARGRISSDQLRDVATEYESRKLINPKSGDYRKIAVTHHHPFPFMEHKEKPIQRARLRLAGQERFIRMENAEQFLTWCASRNIPLIMHGHKHVPRHVSQVINTKNAEAREVTAVGCGASLGVGGKPLSYNLVSWVPDTGRWSVNFFSDPGDGRGFEEDYMVLHTVSAAT